jgi:hypothetical protein
MKKSIVTVLITAALASFAFGADQAPAPGSPPAKKAPAPRVSPPGVAEATIDGAHVKIAYSRPYIKDPKTGEARTVWGGTLVPSGAVWRTGANEATLITTDKALQFGSTTIPAGTYSVWTWMGEDGKSAKLIFNKQIGQWGKNADMKKVYDEANDLARVDLHSAKLATPTDQFTIVVEPKGKSGAIRLQWADTEYVVPFTVKA